MYVRPLLVLIIFGVVLVAVVAVLLLTLSGKTCGSCDDFNACTADSCETNRCVHTTIPCLGDKKCEQGEENTTDCGVCTDGNVCTNDVYNESTQTCTFTPIWPCCGDGLCSSGETFTCGDCVFSEIKNGTTITGTALIIADIITEETLIINEGATIVFGNDSAHLAQGGAPELALLLNDPTANDAYGKEHITLQARIIAKGRSDNPVIFTSPDAYGWEGIVLLPGSDVKHAIIENARSGVLVREGATFQNNIVRGALWTCINTTTTLRENTVENCGIAGIAAENVLVADNNIFLTPIGILTTNATLENNKLAKVGKVIWPCSTCRNKNGTAILLAVQEQLGYKYTGNVIYWSDDSGDLFEMRNRSATGHFVPVDEFLNEKLSYTQKNAT